MAWACHPEHLESPTKPARLVECCSSLRCGSGCPVSRLQLPTCTVCRIDVRVGSVIVRETDLLFIPLQCLSRKTNGNRADQRDLGQWTTVIKIGTRLAARANGFKPVPMMTFDARDFLRWRVFAGVLFH